MSHLYSTLITHSLSIPQPLSFASTDLEIAEGGSVKGLIVEGPIQGDAGPSVSQGDPFSLLALAGPAEALGGWGVFLPVHLIPATKSAFHLPLEASE